jgi:hypothetical protein
VSRASGTRLERLWTAIDRSAPRAGRKGPRPIYVGGRVFHLPGLAAVRRRALLEERLKEPGRGADLAEARRRARREVLAFGRFWRRLWEGAMVAGLDIRLGRGECVEVPL